MYLYLHGPNMEEMYTLHGYRGELELEEGETWILSSPPPFFLLPPPPQQKLILLLLVKVAQFLMKAEKHSSLTSPSSHFNASLTKLLALYVAVAAVGTRCLHRGWPLPSTHICYLHTQSLSVDFRVCVRVCTCSGGLSHGLVCTLLLYGTHTHSCGYCRRDIIMAVGSQQKRNHQPGRVPYYVVHYTYAQELPIH